ncbi:hypothetical protein BC828DRAFT_405878 [Blastocladiella britannica]|nr:hypothetical protein BC828DRAFT_405878 [Blastocladiella britannica]
MSDAMQVDDTSSATAAPTATTEGGGAMEIDPNAPVPADPLPPRLERLRTRTVTHPDDPDAWRALCAECANTRELRDRPADVLAVFDRALSRFPFDTKLWPLYLDTASALLPSDDPALASLFARALRDIKHIDVLKAYLTHIRRTHPVVGDDPSSNRSVVAQAYAYILGDSGGAMHDVGAASLWREYIDFLKSTPVHNAYEEELRHADLRAVYMQAVGVPHALVESMWREWDTMENAARAAAGGGGGYPGGSVNAKKLLADRSAAHLAARTAYRTLRTLWDAIDRATPVAGPSSSSAAMGPAPAHWMTPWRALLAWEKGNPMRLDPAARSARIAWCYWQWVLRVPRVPEIWYEFAAWFRSEGRDADAEALLRAGCEACKDSLLLHFTLADMLELKGDAEKTSKVYEQLVERLQPHVSHVVSSETASGGKGSADPAATDNGDEPPTVRQAKRALSFAYVTWMRSAARAQGLTAQRGVFRRARADLKMITWHVPAASAMLEYYYGGGDAAGGAADGSGGGTPGGDGATAAVSTAPATATSISVPQRLLTWAIDQFPGTAGPVLAFADHLRATRDPAKIVAKLVPVWSARALPPADLRAVGDRLAAAYRDAGDLREMEKREAELRDLASRLALARIGGGGKDADATATAAVAGPREREADDTARSVEALRLACLRYAYLGEDAVGERELGIESVAVSAGTRPSTSTRRGGADDRTTDTYSTNHHNASGSNGGSSSSYDHHHRSGSTSDQGSLDAAGRRAFLENWTPPDHVVAPAVVEGRPSSGPYGAAAAPGTSTAPGWAPFRPPRMSDDERRALVDAATKTHSAAVRDARARDDDERSRRRGGGERGDRDDRSGSATDNGGPAAAAPAPQAKVPHPIDVLVAFARRLPPASAMSGLPTMDPTGIMNLLLQVAPRLPAPTVDRSRALLAYTPPPSLSSGSGAARDPRLGGSSGSSLSGAPRDPRYSSSSSYGPGGRDDRSSSRDRDHDRHHSDRDYPLASRDPRHRRDRSRSRDRGSGGGDPRGGGGGGRRSSIDRYLPGGTGAPKRRGGGASDDGPSSKRYHR